MSWNKHQKFLIWEYRDSHVQGTVAFFKRVLKLGEEDPEAGE